MKSTVIEAKYKELADFIYQHCLKYGCADDGGVTGECCKRVNTDFGIRNCTFGETICSSAPHERVVCSIFFCERIVEKAGPEFMVKYRELMSELRTIDPRIDYIGGYKKVGS